MRSVRFLISAACVVLVAPPAVRSQDKPLRGGEADDPHVRRIQKLLEEVEIDAKPLEAKTPLAKFLTALEAQLPKDAKVQLRIDREAFGADLPRLAQAQVWLLHYAKPLKTNLRAALNAILKQLPKDIAVDYGIRADGIVLTQPKLAAHRAVHDVRDILPHMPAIRGDWLRYQADVFQGIPAGADTAALVRWVVNSIEPRPWETMDLLNGTRLAFVASPARQAELGDVLTALRRLTDNHVVMNARLYEVDRAFYSKEVAPLFAKPTDDKERPSILPIEKNLFKKITAGTMLLESEEVRIRPHQATLFLSKQGAFAYKTDQPLRATAIDWPGFAPEKLRETVIGSGLAGVTFKVVGQISPDRRYLRLTVTQEVTQLVGIDKVKKLDTASGKEIEVESPNVSRSRLAGTVQIPDGHPVVMPVVYRPAPKGNGLLPKNWSRWYESL